MHASVNGECLSVEDVACLLFGTGLLATSRLSPRAIETFCLAPGAIEHILALPVALYLGLPASSMT